MTEQTALYRFFDRNDQLLYVGISKNAIRRMLDHAEEKSWWQFVKRSSIEYHPTRSDALRAEREAIEQEAPLYNITHNRRPTELDPRDGRFYGPWRFQALNLTLELDLDGNWIYEIDLEKCTTSASCLDWIMQINGKSWADAAVVAGLVEALDELLHPQATLCSSGVERGPINVARRIPELRREDEDFEAVFGPLLAAAGVGEPQ